MELEHQPYETANHLSAANETTGVLTADLFYGMLGRPERVYLKK